MCNKKIKQLTMIVLFINSAMAIAFIKDAKLDFFEIYKKKIDIFSIYK